MTFLCNGQYFSPSEVAAGLAAADYDFNGDGLANLLEYAPGRNRRTGAGGNLPAVSKADSTLQIQFDRDSSKTDLTYLLSNKKSPGSAGETLKV